ncbi:MAG: AAA family ATPase, partial [Chlamydiota bacterium]
MIIATGEKMKKLPIGIDDYKEIIEDGYAYVDKTLLIQEIIERGTKLALIPRPRRFGKTINMSMLRYFFENKAHSHLFSPYKIWQTKYRELQGQHPVIFFTLKDVKQTTWQLTFDNLKSLIADEFERHRHLLDSPQLSPEEKESFRLILRKQGNQSDYEFSLKRLIIWLERYHGKKVMVLIDEYDSPVHKAYFHGFYPNIVDFMRNWLGGGLKSNASLEKAVITGIMRIAKENIFSDLNHSSNFTTFSEDFGDKFGLLEEEVNALLTEYGMDDKLEEVRSWYNGYKMGDYSVYNPWSIIKYIQHKTFKPYWVGTSGNDLIKEQLAQKGTFFKEDFETLLLGESITKLVDEGLVFASLEDSTESIWGLLLFSGYLTLTEMPNFTRTRYSCKLKIPNQEVLNLFQDMIQDYFSKRFSIPIPSLIEDLLIGNVKAFSEKFEKFILNVFSAYDIPEPAFDAP